MRRRRATLLLPLQQTCELILAGGRYGPGRGEDDFKVKRVTIRDHCDSSAKRRMRTLVYEPSEKTHLLCTEDCPVAD